jgi:hypothetical protein
MPQYLPIAVAAAFALIGLLPLAGRNVFRPLLWLTVLVGVAVGYLAREGTQVAMDILGPYLAMGADPSSAIVSTLVAAAIGELLKATPALIAISIASADDSTGLALGAAAGAGFGAFVTWPVLAFALSLIGSPLTSALFTGVAVFGWFLRILAHIVTTGYVGRAGVVGGLGWALLFAVIIQFVLGLSERMPLLGAIPSGVLVAAVIALAMFTYLWSVRMRAAAGS